MLGVDKNRRALAAAVSDAERALNDVPKGDDPGDIARRCSNGYQLGVALSEAGRLEEAVSAFRAVERLIESLEGLEKLRMLLGSRMAAVFYRLDRYQDVVAATDQIAGVAADVAGVDLTAGAHALRCCALIALQRWSAAGSAGRALAEISEPDASSLQRGFFALGRYTEGVAARELGEPDAALAAVEDAIAAARGLPLRNDPGQVSIGQMLLARAAMLEDLGRTSDAKSAYAEAIVEAKREPDQATRHRVRLARQRRFAIRLGAAPAKTLTQQEAARQIDGE